MSEQVILRWLETVDRKLTAVAADVAALRESLAGCQASHKAERGSWLRRRGVLTKILGAAIVAAASALATKYGITP